MSEGENEPAGDMDDTVERPELLSRSVREDAAESTPVAVDADDAPAPGQRTRRRRWLPFVIAGVLVLAAAGGVLTWQLTSTNAAPTSRQQTFTVSKQTLQQTVGATGTIEPAQQSALSFSSSGTVQDVDVEVGDKVTKGEVLASIDDATLRADVDSARAALNAAQDDLGDLQDSDDSTDAQLSSAEASVKLKKSQLAQAKDALMGADLTAPFDGVVAEVGIAEGDSTGSGASSSSTSTSGTGGSSGSGDSGSGSVGSGSSGTSSSSSSSAITVISTDSWIVDTSVGSSDLDSLKKGLQAKITPSSGGDTVFGTVQSIGVMASSSDSGSSTFPVTIKITGSPKGLHAGASADVSIIVKELQNVLTVPTMAIKTADNKPVVQKVSGDKSVQTKITIGQTLGAQTVVKSGLSEGDQVQITLNTPGRTGSGNSQGSNGSREGEGGGFGNLSGSGSGGFPGGGMPGGGGFPAGGQQGNR